MTYIISTFYKFFPFIDYFEHRNGITAFLKQQGICGNVLLASEGINSTICGSREAIDATYAFFETMPIGALEVKESETDQLAFRKLKVRLKKELISLGKPAEPMTKTGTYVTPDDWNALIARKDVVVLDTRNDYEYEHGSFEGAIDPKIDDFKQLPDYIENTLSVAKDTPIATFCTGGIRCEKLTAYLLDEGYSEIYHLKGGIIQYLKDVPKEKSTWNGECFVFDDRITIGHDDA